MATLLVNDVTPRVQYTASSSQTVFAYGFSIFVDTDLKVYKGSTLMTLSSASNNTSYQVSGAGTTAGGNVTFGAGLTAGDIVTIYRDLPVSRTSDYQTGGDLLAETLNDDLDKIVQMVQQVERDIDQRTLRFGQFTTGIPLAEFTESATDRANKVLAFAADGSPNITQELGTFLGNWAASTAYVIRDLVKDTSNNNIYICTVAHTSSGAQPLSSNTDAAKWSLIVDAASATTSASAAATSATASATSATAAATSATAAATSATAGATSATAAATSATASASSATAAAASATSAAAALDSFDDIYLGAKSSDPTVDNDGDALTAGDLYFSTATNRMRVYSGSAWADVALDSATVVAKTSATGSGVLPSGTTAQRDGSPSAGYLRFNSTTSSFEGHNGSAWAPVGGGATGGSGEQVFVENENQIDNNYTITTNFNALTTGPITVASGVTVTVPSGSSWIIL